MTTLKIGDKSDGVKQMQTMLNQVLLPSPSLDVDGEFGGQTQAALTRFQIAVRIRPTGFGDSVTIAKLVADSTAHVRHQKAMPHQNPHLRESALQVALKQAGVEEDAAHTNHGVKVEMYLASVQLKGGAPWCAAYVCWCYAWATKKSGSYNPILMTGDCYALYEWALNTNRLTDSPERGDVIRRNHNNTVDTIEGNTNPQGGSDGYGVFKRNRTLSSCLFVHVC